MTKSPLTPMGYVYETVCLINRKTYIGLRYYSRDEGRDWLFYLGSGKLLKAAVLKHGRENFTKRKLAEAFSESELQETEWRLIQEAKAVGKAEYNLFLGPGAGGNTFSRMTPERLEEIRQKQSLGLKEFRKRTASERAEKFEQAFQDFKLTKERAVLEEFSRLRLVKPLLEIFNAPGSWVRRILRENEVNVRLINELPKAKRAEIHRNYAKVSETMLNKRLKSGLTALELHDSVLNRVDELQELRLRKTRRQLEEHFDVKHDWLNVFLRDHKIPNKADTVVDSSDCKRCKISSAQSE